LVRTAPAAWRAFVRRRAVAWVIEIAISERTQEVKMADVGVTLRPFSATFDVFSKLRVHATEGMSSPREYRIDNQKMIGFPGQR
jgi:hypothetical protein